MRWSPNLQVVLHFGLPQRVASDPSWLCALIPMPRCSELHFSVDSDAIAKHWDYTFQNCQPEDCSSQVLSYWRKRKRALRGRIIVATPRPSAQFPDASSTARDGYSSLSRSSW